MIRSHLTGRAIVIQLTDVPEPLLLVEVDIECPQCGPHHLKIAGHHLRALRNLLNEFIDLHPALTGQESGIEVINRLQFAGRPTNRPEEN